MVESLRKKRRGEEMEGNNLAAIPFRVLTVAGEVQSHF